MFLWVFADILCVLYVGTNICVVDIGINISVVYISTNICVVYIDTTRLVAHPELLLCFSHLFTCMMVSLQKCHFVLVYVSVIDFKWCVNRNVFTWCGTFLSRACACICVFVYQRENLLYLTVCLTDSEILFIGWAEITNSTSFGVSTCVSRSA